MYSPTLRSEGHNLHEFAIWISWQRWNLMWNTWSIYWSAFSWSKPKLFWLKQHEVWFRCLHQGQIQMIRVLSFTTSVIAGFFWNFCSASLKMHSSAHAQKKNLLHMSYSYIFTVYNSSNLFKILPNVSDPH